MTQTRAADSLPQNGGLRTMVVDDESVIRGPVGLCLETLGHHVVEAASIEEAVAAAGRGTLDLALVDLRLGTGSGLDLISRLLALQPRMRIIVISAYGSVDLAVKAMARGAMDFLCKPFTPEQLAATVARAASIQALESHVAIMPDRWGTAGPEADFATTSAALQEAIVTVRRAAPGEQSILIMGEAGVGKGVLARAIHGWGCRPEGPFVAVDCAAHSAGFMDLALFGETMSGDQMVHAEQKTALVRAAGGTLLLKHIEALGTGAQERLAKLLEGRGGGRAGGDCRLIVTSNDARGLQGRLIRALGVVRVNVPPLRQRVEDIPMLVQRYVAFARQSRGKMVHGFSVEAVDRLMGYEWPGNLRELHGVTEEAFAVAEGPLILPQHLPEAVRSAGQQKRLRAGDAVSLRDLEAAHIRGVLATQKSLQEAADVLGLDLQALYRRRKQFGLD